MATDKTTSGYTKNLTQIKNDRLAKVMQRVENHFEGKEYTKNQWDSFCIGQLSQEVINIEREMEERKESAIDYVNDLIDRKDGEIMQLKAIIVKQNAPKK